MSVEKFLEVLNNNPKSKAMLDRFNKVAAETNLIGAEYDKARETVVMMAIACDKELINQLAEEIYNEVNDK